MRLTYIIGFLTFLTAFYSVVYAFDGTISGKVIDASTQQPIAGAIIAIPDIKTSAVTDNNGQFTLHSITNRGKFLIEVRFIGYKSITRIVDFSREEFLEFALEPSSLEMREVVITGTAISSNSKKNSTSVATLGREQMLTASTNIVDAIAKQVPGVSQITTGLSISKPVIRGLGYNRVVTLNDGVKQQGQQWGDEHGIEIDQYSAERVEVLRGAASLLYGSDALGGVVNLLEPLPVPRGTVRGELLSNYASNNGLTSTSAMLTGNVDGFVWRGRATYKNAHSFKTPTGFFPNSGYNETDFNAMLGLNKVWGYSHVNFSYFKNNIGFYEPLFNDQGDYINEEGEGFTDKDHKNRRLAFPKQAINHYKVGWNSKLLLPSGSLRIDLGFQQNQRKELEQAVPELFFELDTYSADLKYYLTESNGWQPVFGISGDAGFSRNKGEEFLIPDYETYGIGAFVYIKKTWDNNTLNAGIRYDHRKNNGKALEEEGEIRFTAFNNQFSNLSGALGYTHIFNDFLNFKANAGSAFRSPNPAELGSNGVHEGTFRYEVGNHELKPERSYQADATLEFGNHIIKGSMGVYNNYIDHYIYASHVPGDNREVVDEDGIIAEFPVYRYGQVKANLYGFEGSLTLHPVAFIHFENTFGYTHAQNLTLKRPLSFIPAATLHHTLRFEPAIQGTRESYFSIGIDNFFKQNRVDDTFETPTAGYALLNAGVGTTFLLGKQTLKISVSANNLLDKKYYNALSRLKPGRLDHNDPSLGVYNPGRDITIGFYLPFGLNH